MTTALLTRKQRSRQLADGHVNDDSFRRTDDPVVVTSVSDLPSSWKPSVAVMGYEGARHRVAEYLPSARGQRVVSVRLPDLNGQTTAFIKDIRHGIKRIDLSGHQMQHVPEELVSSLDGLVQLDVSSNSLAELSLPRDCQCLPHLVEILAQNNSLCRTLTPDVAALVAPSLRRLNVANNRLTSFDGIERLVNLEVLITDDNLLEAIGETIFSALGKLQVFHCARNSIASIPTTIRQLQSLRDIDLSQNRLTSIPSELISLPKLEMINLSHNSIARVPTIHSHSKAATAARIQQRRLNVVDLSDNRLVKFPEQLATLVRLRLDISRNFIRVVPLSLNRKLIVVTLASDYFVKKSDDGCSNVTLNMDGNPVTCPPEEVCRAGTRSILNFLSEAKIRLPTYQGLKVLVIGSSGQGKTSLVQTLIDDQPTLTGNDRTMFIDTFSHTLDAVDHNNNNVVSSRDDNNITSGADANDAADKSFLAATYGRQLNLSIWDLSGNVRYSTAMWHFVEPQALMLIVFSLADYNEQQFDRLVGSWFDLALGKSNRLSCIVVGTHADRVDSDVVGKLKRTVMDNVNSYLSKRAQFLDEVIQSIESLRHIDPVLSEHLKQCLNLKKVDVRVHDELICVSSLLNTGFVDLADAIRRLGQDTTAFPSTLRPIPSLWDDVDRYVEDQGRLLSLPVLPWNDYEKMIVGRFGLKRAVPAITQYLHDTGKVLLLAKNGNLPACVVLRPAWLLDSLRCILRQDMPAEVSSSTLTTTSSSSSQVVPKTISADSTGARQSRQERLYVELSKQGLANIDCLRTLWSHLITATQSADTNESVSVNDVIYHVITSLQLGYQLSSSFVRDGATSRPPLNVTRSSANNKSGNQGNAEQSGDAVAVATETVRTRYLLSCLRRVGKPRTFQAEYDRHIDMPHLAAVYQFPICSPASIFFDLLTVKLGTSVVANTSTTATPKSPRATTTRTTRQTRRTNAYRINDNLSRDRSTTAQSINLVAVYHWQYGFYAYDSEQPVRVFVQRGHRTDGVPFIRIETRHEKRPPGGAAATMSSADEIAENLWSVMLPILDSTDTLLARFSGVFVERRMECPLCHSASFHGSWQTPKQLQSTKSVTCQSCSQLVSTALLVQPKEKRLIDEFLQMLAAQEDQELTEQSLTTATDKQSPAPLPTTQT